MKIYADGKVVKKDAAILMQKFKVAENCGRRENPLF